MSRETISMTPELRRYLGEVLLREPEVFRALREETGRMDEAHMQIAAEQGQLMTLLVELVGARRAIEIGTFTGYSALCIARGLPPDGRLICCDRSTEWTAVARRYWELAGLASRIELRLGPALATLDALLADGQAGTFDFVFIDADKPEYDDYYERSLALLRRGGLVTLDNALNNGRVVDPAAHPDTHAAVHDRMNRKIHADERVTMSLVPIADGLMIARKR